MNESMISFGTLVLSTLSLIVGIAENQQQEADQKTAAEVSIPDDGITVLRATEGNNVQGVIRLTQTAEGVHLRGEVRGLTPGKHGFHIHEFGDLRASDGKSAGGHFSPEGHQHGGPDDDEHHAGDLGNITADSKGVAKVDILAEDLKLHFVIGRSIVVHGKADDLKSQPSGDAGPRVALGVIGFSEQKIRPTF